VDVASEDGRETRIVDVLPFDEPTISSGALNAIA
jgi:hypothetical protein